MKQVFVAAWVGIMAGWLGFGWVLAEARMDGNGAMQQAELKPAAVMASVDILAEPQTPVKQALRKEPNLRG